MLRHAVCVSRGADALQRKEREANKEAIRKITDQMIEDDRRIARERQEDARLQDEARRERMERDEKQRVRKALPRCVA